MSLLGEGALDITPAMGGTPIPEGGYVKTKRTPGQLADVAESATQGLKEATLLIKDIREGKGTVGKLFTDDAALQRDSGVRRRGRDAWPPISKRDAARPASS